MGGGPQHVPHDEKYFRERQGHRLSPALRGHAGLIYKPHGLKMGFLWKIACESDVSRTDWGSKRPPVLQQTVLHLCTYRQR